MTESEGQTSTSWGYFEAQLHGPVQFDKDVAAIVSAAKFENPCWRWRLRFL